MIDENAWVSTGRVDTYCDGCHVGYRGLRNCDRCRAPICDHCSIPHDRICLTGRISRRVSFTQEKTS